jgi:4-amino-4-deoxy-L-arabinose transferase-like glycosyltransferase
MAVIGSEGDPGVFAARFPSAVAMTLVLVILAVAVSRVAGREQAFWTVLIFSTCGLTLWSAKACTTDAVLLVGILVAQMGLYALWRGNASWAVVIAVAIAIGEAALTKGPVVLGVMGMTLLTLGVFRWIDRRKAADPLPDPQPDYRKRELGAGAMIARAGVAIVIVAALVGPWLYLVNQRESHFLGTSVSHDVLKRIAQPLEGHKGPPGYHLALVFATFFPWSIFLPMTIVSAWKNRHDPLIRFCLAAVLGPWVMFELVRTKLPHYLLPAFPPLALLTADALLRCLRGEKRDLQSRAFFIGLFIISVAMVGIGGATIVLVNRFADPLTPSIVLIAVALLAAALFSVLFAQRKPRHGLLAMGVGVMATYAALFGLYLPSAKSLHLSSRVADILKRHGATSEGDAIMLDYKEPSLAFYQGGTIRENSSMNLTPALLDEAPRWLVITREIWSKTPEATRQRLEIVDTATGLAYADGGRTVEVLVLQKR